jgi:hypothetical protein
MSETGMCGVIFSSTAVRSMVIPFTQVIAAAG